MKAPRDLIRHPDDGHRGCAASTIPGMLSDLDLALIRAMRLLSPDELEQALKEDVLPLAGRPDERQELLARVEYLRRYVKATKWEG